MREVNIIGKRIEYLRNQRGTTQAQLAAALGVKRETIYQWEAGIRDIKTGGVAGLAKYFNVSADWLLGLSDVMSYDQETQAMHSKTGLSEEAIEWFKAAKDELPYCVEAINDLIHGQDLKNLLLMLVAHVVRQNIRFFEGWPVDGEMQYRPLYGIEDLAVHEQSTLVGLTLFLRHISEHWDGKEKYPKLLRPRKTDGEGQSTT